MDETVGLSILHALPPELQLDILDLVEEHHIRMGLEKWRLDMMVLLLEYRCKWRPCILTTSGNVALRYTSGLIVNCRDSKVIQRDKGIYNFKKGCASGHLPSFYY